MLPLRPYLPAIGLFVALATLVAPSIPSVAADAEDFAGGDGSAEDPYQITDWYELDAVRDHLSDHFRLMNDLDAGTAGYGDLAGPTANSNAGWEPIAWMEGEFQGSFDGRGNEIADMYIDNRGSPVGLFGTSSGLIKALRISSGSSNGGQVTGLLVGQSSGEVEDCSADGDAEGSLHVGVLVGWNSGSIERCWSSGSAEGQAAVGGLVGLNEYQVRDCYSLASVGCSPLGSGPVAGLVGYNAGLVDHCYSVGRVVDGVNSGLVGVNMESVSASYWNTESSGQSSSSGGIGKTTSEMMDVDTFSGWDISAVRPGEIDTAATWNIVEGTSYPVFGWYREQFELTEGWNLVSPAVNCCGDGPTVTDVFGDEIEAIYWWDPGTRSYTVPTNISSGCGYWVAVSEDKVITYVA